MWILRDKQYGDFIAAFPNNADAQYYREQELSLNDWDLVSMSLDEFVEYMGEQD